MKKFFEKIKNNKILTIIVLIVIIIMSISINKNSKFLKYFYTRYNELKPEFSFSLFNKNITNDTFFTIAIGQYVLENGNDNMDHLTWHENLEFPHSRSI